MAGVLGASTYAAEDADLLGAEAAYCALEDELQRYLDTYTRTHDYDEYHFDLDTIEHDPYAVSYTHLRRDCGASGNHPGGMERRGVLPDPVAF